MKSNRCPKRATRSASPSSSSASLNYRSSARTSASSSGSALSPVHSASLALFALLLLCAAPLCPGTPVFLNPSTVQHEQLLNLIDNACSSYLSAEQPLRTSDVLRDFCGLMLGVLRKSQELAAREPSKRSTVFHPLLQLIPKLHSRRRRRVESHEEMQGPGAIQSRGYFLYRPRNGRRSTEYV
ncbi:neuromedin-U isoform X2 [Pygocentrus nattereri]|uniref:Neuromedin U C-terminal domain-containing protein n=1 Tax=Pygocentrus nattereri TaxID=42514 RepID=A0A3B4DMS7_PYGNA|nr:neuromedin-U isoform X2 [Pygocentrus nattereri]